MAGLKYSFYTSRSNNNDRLKKFTFSYISVKVKIIKITITFFPDIPCLIQEIYSSGNVLNEKRRYVIYNKTNPLDCIVEN